MPLWDVSGVSGAAPVWQEVMSWLHRATPSRPPVAPEGIVAKRVRFGGAREPARVEYFLAGTEIDNVTLVGDAAAWPRIAYPGHGTIVAFDPDIPSDRQRIALQATAAAAGLRWVLDGTVSADAAADALWAPVPGRHRLVLVDVRGREVDSVAFEVRDAPRVSAAR